MTEIQPPQVPANLNSLDAKSFREALMNYAIQIQDWCQYMDNEFDDDGNNSFDSIHDELNALKTEVTDNNESMQNKINSILLGTDVPSVEIVVEQILKDKGVI